MGTEPLMCGSCRHWFEVSTGGVFELGNRMGQCRESPPAVFGMPTAQQGHMVNIQLQSHYPPIGASFPACSRHTAAKPCISPGEYHDEKKECSGAAVGSVGGGRE